MAGAGDASALKPSAIMLLIAGSLFLTAIALTFAPHTLAVDVERAVLVEVDLDAGDVIQMDVEASADGAVVELVLLTEGSASEGGLRQSTLSRTDEGFDGSISAENGGRHELAILFHGLEGEAQVRYSIEGSATTVWVITLLIAVPVGAWGAWLRYIEDPNEEVG